MTNVQLILFAMAAFALFAGVLLSLKGKRMEALALISLALVIALVSGFGPEKITLLKTSASGLTIETRVVTEAEIEQTLDIASDKPKIGPEVLARIREVIRKREADQRTDTDYLTLSVEAFENRDFNNALNFAELGVKRDSSSVQVKANLQTQAGKAYRELGLYNESILILQEATRTDPKFGGAFTQLGISFSKAGRYHEALAAYAEHILLDPRDPSPYANSWADYMSLNRREEALMSIDSALRIAPDEPTFHYKRGVSLSQMGQHHPAYLAFQEALALNPNYEDAANAMTKERQNALKRGRD